MKKLLLLSALLIFAFGFGQTPITDANFEAAINNCLATNPIDGMCSESEYGAMPDWDVSQVTDMSYAFSGSNFNADISAWDVSNVTNMNSMFTYVGNFTQDISNWDVSSVTDMGSMFYQSWHYTNYLDISSWDVSNVTNMAYMFYRCGNFNQDLSSWDVSNVTDFYFFIEGTGTSVANYDALFTSWSALTLQQGVNFSNTNLQYCSSGAARQSITDNYGWTITDAGLAPGCNDSDELTPITDANFEAAINNCLATNPIDGMCSESEYGAMPDWDVSQVTDMSYAFSGSNFNADISAWDVSNVTNMNSMFTYVGNFTQDISNWDVSSVTDMGSMFYQSWHYTNYLDISSWDVSNVTNMAYMFYRCGNFNQDLSSWDVSNVTDFYFFIEGTGTSVANYDALFTSWSALTLQQGVNFSNTNLQYCSSGAARQSITDNYGWTITDAGLAPGCNDSDELTPITDANFEAAINNCLATNPIDGMCSESEYGAMPDWDVSQVTDMSYAFSGSNFNADISAWDVSNVTNMNSMFTYVGNFTQDISNWDVSSVTDMGSMFYQSWHYTNYLDISSWDVSNVTNMAYMFYRCGNFNQDLSSWDVSNVTDFYFFIEGTGTSVANYDALFTSWSALTLQQGVNFSNTNLQYCSSGAARQSITDNYGWTITDAGLAPGCNDYEWINYGTQDWTVENAEMVTYRDGTPIPQVTDNTEWSNLTTGAWCYYDNDPTKGKLYNWYAVAGIHDNDPNTPNKELAPVGLHVPSDEEWTTLENYLIANGYNYDGTNTGNKIAKAMASTTGWNSSTQTGSVGNDQSQNNSSGFNAFPEGARYTETANYGNGSFDNVGRYAFFWSSTETGTNYAWYRDLVNDLSRIGRAQSYSGDGKQFGFSVRFVRDATSLSITDFSNSIIMYPNPVKNMLTIDGLVVKDVVIYSVLGKAVLNMSNQNTIDVSSLSKGVYFIKVSDGINASTKKFIKE